MIKGMLLLGLIFTLDDHSVISLIQFGIGVFFATYTQFKVTEASPCLMVMTPAQD